MNERFLRDFFHMPPAGKPISLRDYFAAQFLAGAYRVADALLAERERQ